MPSIVAHQCRRTVRVAVMCCALWQGGAVGVQAGNLYVYTDAQGQAVITDTLQQVPLDFRGRARRVSEGEPSTAGALTTELPLPEAASGCHPMRFNRFSAPLPKRFIRLKGSPAIKPPCCLSLELVCWRCSACCSLPPILPSDSWPNAFFCL